MGRAFATILLTLLAVGCQSLVVVRGPNRNTDLVDIEIDWTTPDQPQQYVLNAVKSRIQSLCDPQVQVTLSLDDDLSGSGHGTWTDSDCREFALVHKDGDGFYMIWAEGIRGSNPMIGGYSWDKRSFAVFPQTYGTDTRSLITAVQHEFLHCLGLVGKFLKMQTPHKHEYGNHCNISGCLMQPTNSGSHVCGRCTDDMEAGVEK